MLSPRQIAIQGVGSQPRLIAVQGFAAANPSAPSGSSGRLVYSPFRSPFRSLVREVARWSA